MTGQVILSSSEPHPLAPLLRHGMTVVHIPTASNELPDRDQILAATRQLVDRTGANRIELDLAAASPAEVDSALGSADAVLVGGGDPYLLLDAATRRGFERSTRSLLDRGGTYCGISAGAMLAAPSLEPLRCFSPFPEPPTDADLSGLGLVDLLVLPHTDRAGRRAEHEAALHEYGREHRLVPLVDGESVVVHDGQWSLQLESGMVVRPARTDDARSITELFVAAGRIGWAAFLTNEQLDGIVPDPDTWTDRISSAGHDDLRATESIAVATDADGIAGFIWVRPAPDLDLTEPTGEVATFYTHPRVWGTGLGRRLMAHGLDRLRSMGYHECVLWTEERNERPLRIYAQMGWTLDGASRPRDFHGIDITEIRHRFAL